MTQVQPLKADGDDAPTGVVIVAIPSITDAIRTQTPEQDLHVTLCYLGSVSQGLEFLLPSLLTDVNRVAADYGPFDAEVSGRGRLGDDEAAVIFLESEDLAELHDAILSQPCVAQVVSMSTDQYPTWIPHMTLGGPEYPIEEKTAGELDESITFDAIGIWEGTHRVTFMLTGGAPDDAAELFGDDVDYVTMVDMDDDQLLTLSAAGQKGFTENLHPRGKDGRFIPKFGIIKWLKEGHWKYGRVDGINKDDHGDIVVTATPSDLGGNPTGEASQVLKPDQIYEAPVKVAHLPSSAPGAKKIGAQAGSNPGGLYEIPVPTAFQQQQETAKKFYVKKAKTAEHGRNEELANTLYGDAGVYVPAVDYNPADGNIYSPITEGKHDMDSRLAKNDKEWLDKVRSNFVVDAWLSNRDVFGLTNDNILTDKHGTPVRIDNGGALLYRAMGAKKTDFGSKVTELDIFRTGKKAKVFGKDMTKDQELDGAQRVLAITPGQIDDRVAQAGLPKSLADTLKARRAYIAEYYGLPLPESIKPADTDQIATTAPLLDAADISAGKGKSRTWFPMTLTSAAFVATVGDYVELPNNKTGVVGQKDGKLLSTVGIQAQFLEWTHEFGADAKVMTFKVVGDKQRPEHGATLASNQLAGVGWQRGDRLIDGNGNELKVLGANSENGGILLQTVMPEGIASPPPFLYDSLATDPYHKTFIVKRWDPPAVVETTLDEAGGIVPAEPVVPGVPEGQAVEAVTKIKEDLVVPLPAGNGPPPAPKTAVAPGEKKMLLGDGTEAAAGDTVVSKFGGSYVFVKPKGPYAVVTDPNSADPEKLLTKKASTLLQPGKEKAAVPGEDTAKPTTADGQVPQIGMQAKAKDGHEGEITMISPDGKFVFITDANGKKKRKSVGTVSITGAPSAPVVQETPEPEPTPEAPADESLAALWEQLTSQNPPALWGTTTDESEFKPVKELDLKPGDKISTDGKEWDTVTETEYGATTVTTPGGTAYKIPDSDLNTWAVTPVAEAPPAPEPEAVPDIDLPGGYVPNADETVLKMTPPLPNQPEYVVGHGDGEWVLLTANGPDLDYPLQDDDIFNNIDGMPVTVVHGPIPEAANKPPVKHMDLVDPNVFAHLDAGDQLTVGDKTYVAVGMSMMQGNNGVIAVYDNQTGALVPFYLSSFKPDTPVTVQANPNYGGMASLPGGENLDANAIYDNAWKTPAAENLAGTAGNAAISYLALQQGLDPNAQKWLAYDQSDESFWDLTDPYGTGEALKWDQATHSWNAEPALSVHAMQPVIKNDLPPGPQAPAEPVGLPVYTYTNPSGGSTTFVKVGPDWVDQDDLDKGNDPAVVGWTDYEMAIHFDFDKDKVVYVPKTETPPGVPQYGGYTPQVGDKVVSLTSGFDGGSVETFWVQKSGQTDWLGVLTYQDGKLNTTHPMPDHDLQAMEGLDNWTKTELYGFAGSPDTPTASPDEIPAGYPVSANETVIFMPGPDGGGIYLTSNDGGETWQEIGSDGFLKEAVWTKADFEGGDGPENYTVLQEAAPSEYPSPQMAEDGYNYSPGPDETVIHTEYGTWLTSKDDGATWHEITEDGYVTDTTWYPDDLPEHYDTVHSPEKPSTTEPVPEPEPPPPPPVLEPTILKPPPAMHPDLANLPGGYTPKNGKKIRMATWGATGGGTTPTYWEAVTAKGAFWKQILPDGTIGDQKVGTAKLPGWGSTEIFDGNLKGLQEMQDGKVGPSGLPLSVVPHQPVDIATLPQPIQEFLAENPGTGLTKLGNTNEPDKNPGYYLTTPDGLIHPYSFLHDQVNPDGKLSNQALLKSWNIKQTQGDYFTLEDVTPDPTAPAAQPVPTPEPVAVPEVVEPAAPPGVPELTIKVPGTTDHPATPNGYQLQPGQQVSHAGNYWFAEITPGAWKMVMKDGSGLGTFTYSMSEFEDFKSQDITVETYQVPAPTTFGGYTALPGDTVVKSDQVHWVKPQGSNTWHMVNENGSLSTTNTASDPTVEWAVSDLGASVVYGTFDTTPEPVTPLPTTTPGAKPGTKITWADLSTEDGPLQYGEQALTALGEIPEGHTLWVYSSGMYPYLVSNTGDVSYVNDDGSLTKISVKPNGSQQVIVGTPSEAPVSPLAPKMTGWAVNLMPPPSIMPMLSADSVVTVPEGGAWAVEQVGDNKLWMHMKPGVYDLSEGGSIPVDQIAGVDANNVIQAPSPYEGGLFKVTPGGNTWVDPFVLGQPGAPVTSPPVSTETAPEVKTEPPKWPGEKKPSQADIDSWGGTLTKDGHIPTVGMFVKRASMTGKIIAVNKATGKATVLTSDGTKSQRLISLLTADSSANYQAYAPKAAVVDIPDGVALAVDPPGEALTKTMQDGKWRPILSNTAGVKGGSIVLTSTKTPSGKKVARMQLTLTNEQREALLVKLQAGDPAGAAPQEKGDWVSVSKASQAVAVGDNIPMRKSSQTNPDGSDKWKVDSTVTPPTHIVTKVEEGPDGVKVVTLKHVNTGAEIKSNFHPDKSLDVYTWDPDKVKPKPPQPAGSWKLGAIAQSQGWSKADSGDYMLAKIEGGTVNGTLSVEPGKKVTGSNAAITWVSNGGVRKVSSNGVIIEVIGLDNKSINSANGVTVVTIPQGLDESAIGQALQDLDIPYEPMNQETAKHAVRGILRNLLATDLKDPDGVKGWSDAKLFTEMGTAVGISDIGWQDVIVGTEGSTGKLTYYWSQRVQDAMMAKTKFSMVVRGGSKHTPEALASQLQYGHADGVLKRVAGMQGGMGVSAGADTQNNAAHGSYSSALGAGHANQGLPGSNPLFPKGAGFMAYSHPMAIMGRIQDWRTGPDQATASMGSGYGSTDVYGVGPANNKSGASKSSIKQAMTQKNSPDFWLGHGFGPDTIGFVATEYESDRKAAIKVLHDQGIFEVNGRKVEDILITKKQAAALKPSDIPPPALPPNARPILDLPTAVTAGMKVAA